MDQTKFLNTAQPQTLVIATMLLYLNAVFGILSFGPIGITIGLVMGFGGFGIANERKWGYSLGVAGAGANVLLLIIVFGFDVLTGLLVITFMFDVALFALLMHPMSRDYQKIWFK